MKSFLMEGAKRLGSLLWKLLLWLKKTLTKIVKTRRLRNQVGMIVVLVLVWIWGVHYGAKHVELPEPEIKIVTVYATPDPEEAHTITVQSQQEADREANLTILAKVLYGYRNNSDIDLEGIVWTILNRVDNEAEFRNYGTIMQVCKQPHQWIGYNESNPVIEHLYEIADKVLTKYESDGARLFGKEYLYFDWSEEYITFKTELYNSRTCKRWRSY